MRFGVSVVDHSTGDSGEVFAAGKALFAQDSPSGVDVAVAFVHDHPMRGVDDCSVGAVVPVHVEVAGSGQSGQLRPRLLTCTTGTLRRDSVVLTLLRGIVGCAESLASVSCIRMVSECPNCRHANRSGSSMADGCTARGGQIAERIRGITGTFAAQPDGEQAPS